MEHSEIEHTPRISESREPIINTTGGHPRIYAKSMYFEQQIPNSLQAIYLRQSAYEKLKEAITLLPDEFSLILYDGYRPLQVQQYLFQQFSDKIRTSHPGYSEKEILEETLKYVAFPSTELSKTSPHVTGGAIDLTLGDKEGNPINMGSGFDEMSEKSTTRYYEQHFTGNDEALKNRRLLYNAMTAVGFTNYSEEWWHFDYGNSTWARRVQALEAKYGAVCALIELHQVKEFRYL